MAIIHRVGATLLALTLLLAGCGDGDDAADQADESSTDVNDDYDADYAADQETESLTDDADYADDQETESLTDVAAGCVPAPVDAGWETVVSACRYQDGTVEVVNESSWVLVAQAPTAYRLDIMPSGDVSPLRTSAMDALLGNARPLAGGGRYLLPGATARAWGAGRVNLYADFRVTPQTYAVDLAAQWIEGWGNRLKPYGFRLASSVASCANGVVNIWDQQVRPTGQRVPLGATFLDVIRGGLLCKGMVQEVYGLLDDAPPPPPTLAIEFRGLVKSVGFSVVDDLLRLGRQVIMS